ncbi:hypothetical protein DFH08DRAFT_940263, partial [Mycena albidolilacea]
MLLSPILSALFLTLRLTAATTWSPSKFAVVNVATSGARTYFYGGNGTIMEISTGGVPSNPAGYNTWAFEPGISTLNIRNAAPSTDIAVVGYVSPATEGFAVRLFYQATNGEIITAYHSGVGGDPLWQLDPVVIATVPLGTPLSAFQSNLNGVLPQVIVIQYTDANGLLTQRVTTTDGIDGIWSAPFRHAWEKQSKVRPRQAAGAKVRVTFFTLGADVTEKELTGTSFTRIIAQAKKLAPNLWRVLLQLARSPKQQKQSPKKDPAKMILVVIAIFKYTRSHHRGRVQKLFTIYSKFKGLSAKGFDTFHAIGLTMSNEWTGDAVGRISDAAMAELKGLMDRFPWLMSYDNVLLAFKVFSQRVNKRTLLGNGTAATIYIKRSAMQRRIDVEYRR